MVSEINGFSDVLISNDQRFFAGFGVNLECNDAVVKIHREDVLKLINRSHIDLRRKSIGVEPV